MSLTFTVRFTDVDLRYIAHKFFAEFEDELCVWDFGIAANDGRMLSSADGITFATLFSVDNGDVGNCNNDDGNGIAVFEKHLFSCLYRSDAVSPKVIEYDSVFGTVTNHLVNPQGGGNNNYMTHNLIVWNRKLWVITDVTAGVSDRRVVYYYDGSSWAAITDYDGASYLTFNKTDGTSPVVQLKHRVSRLFVFNGELYFVATRYDSTNSKWAWEIWRFDAEDYDNFTKIYDSAAFDDDYVLSGILTNPKDGKCYIIGNTVAANGNPLKPGKLYSSPDMENWTAEGTFATLGFCNGEEFYDGRIYVNCINTTNNRTQIKHFDDDLGDVTQDQEITSNTNVRGGGMESFLGDLYIGKYKEIWGADAPTYKQTRTKAQSGFGMEMTFKNKAGAETLKRYAPIDTRAAGRFYSGKIKTLSSLQRSIDDNTGLFRIADMNAVLDNSDLEFSKLLASNYLKGQTAKLYHFWMDEPERLREHIVTLFVEDQAIRGADFKVKMKDITQKYFEKKVPAEICTSEDFADIHSDYEGDPMPEVLGLASLTTGKNLGAVKAIYTDTTLFRYLASAGMLDSVPQVYSDNVLMATPGDYSIVYAGGRTYIDFVGDQGTNDVSFNATGYSFVAWDSVNGYIQNPAYIMLYFLRYIMDIPFAALNVLSFDNLADIYDEMGVGTNGKLILQRRNDAIEIFRQLLFTFGAKAFVAKDGKLKVARKDISAYSTDIFVFDQVDLLRPGDRKWNLIKAMNIENARFDYIPWLRLFKSALTETRATFPERLEDDRPLRPEDLPV